MSANEKPSEMASMYLLTCKEFWQTIISITKKAGGDHAIESNTLHAFIAFSIDRVTGCDNLQSQFDEANRQILQLETENQSLAEENQRLRGVLQLLAKGSNPLSGLPYQSWVRHTAREALKAKSDKASFPAD